MTTPSKELLSAVLGGDISSVSVAGNKITYTIPNYETEEDGELTYIDLGTNINIYELQHKIKEWASVCGYSLSSFWCFEKQDWSCWIEQKDGKFMGMNNYYHADTEFEAVVKACEWILSGKV